MKLDRISNKGEVSIDILILIVIILSILAIIFVAIITNDTNDYHEKKEAEVEGRMIDAALADTGVIISSISDDNLTEEDVRAKIREYIIMIEDSRANSSTNK
jgi:uncharacterized protein (UPF0333 family)